MEETTVEIPAKVSPSSPAEVDNEPAVSEEAPPAHHTESLSHLLPEGKFAQISPRCYMFPGAEVTLDNMEGDSEDSEDEFSDDDEEDENENEAASTSANEIIVPDIDNVLSNEVPVPETSPTPTSGSGTLSPTPSSSCQLQCTDHETVEIITTDIQADDDANDDLEPAPIKRPRLENDAEPVF